SRRRHTRFSRDWSSDVCSSDLGASTLNIASALYYSQVKQGNKVDFTTLDIRDVNCTKTKPWLDYGTKYSPLEMIEKFNYDSFVRSEERRVGKECRSGLSTYQ